MSGDRASASAGRNRVDGPSPSGHWFAARVSVALIVAALFGLLWFLHRQDVEENRTALIRDVLWLEQNVGLSLDRNVEHLRQIAGSVGPDLDPQRLATGVQHLLPSSPGLVEVIMLDAEGRLRANAPGPARHPGEHWISPALDRPYRLAVSTGKPTYGPPRPSGGSQHVEVLVPWFHHGTLVGTLVGVYDLRALLGGLVPWWFAERHQVTVRDARGSILATRSHLDVKPAGALQHKVELDPPGNGLFLEVSSYGSGTTLVRNVLAVTILGLALTVLWSLWTLRRQSQRRLAVEHALRREHAFLKAMEDSLETGMRAVDLEGRMIYVNPAFCRMVGFSEAELIGHLPPQPYWSSEDVERIQDSMRIARSGAPPAKGMEYEFIHKSGRRFDALLYEAPLVDAEGRQVGWMASVLDITERKQARARARQQEEKLAVTARLVTMGEMASSIAHELNQPLSAISSYSAGCRNLLAAGQAVPGDLDQALEKILQQAQRAGRIIRRVHHFVRKSEPTRQRLRLDGVLDEAIGFVQAEARTRHVKIQRGAIPDLEIEADPVLLQQVLLNLLRNAMDAMASTPPDDRELLVDAEHREAAVTVRVCDRGCGIPPEIEKQLFDPFFTTKPEGMGMGLNICRSIIEIHGGRLWAEPGSVGGARFCFSLPLPHDGATEAAPPPQHEEVA
jgi:two-component system sensor histidine kinase DctS